MKQIGKTHALSKITFPGVAQSISSIFSLGYAS